MSNAPPKAKDGPMNATAAANYLGIHNNTLKRIPPAEIPYFTVAARGDRRYRKADLDAYILRRTVDR